MFWRAALLLLAALGQNPGAVTFLHIVPGTARPAFITTTMDTVPDPCAVPTVQNQTSGVWTDPAVWGGAVPSTDAKVWIIPGSTVTVDTVIVPTLNCVGIDGTLSFATGVTTSLKVGTALVSSGGHLVMGTAASPANNASLIIADKPLDTVFDRNQYNTGLLVWGEFTSYGAIKDSFQRVSLEPLKNSTSFTLEQPPVGWLPGDRIVIPDTRHLTQQTKSPYIPQWEELTILSVVGNVVNLTSPLAFDHKGARDATGHLDFLPHVVNLSRSVVIKSENPAGTRGHVWATSRANVDIRYTAFKDLGRTKIDYLDSSNAAHVGTNQIGRYPLHMHHLIGPMTPQSNGRQFTLIGNSVDQGSARHKFKWGVAVHESHYGLLQQNVVYNVAGASFMTEDGSETENLFDRNFALRSYSDYPDRGDGRRPQGEYGHEASGFWIRGPNNRLRDNVAANILDAGPDSAYGYKLFAYFLGNITVPKSQGMDPMSPGGGTVIESYKLPFLEFARNEVYGATASGLTWWWIGMNFLTPRAAIETTIKDFRVWHVYDKGIYSYGGYPFIVDGMVMRGQPANSACCNIGIELTDYAAPNIIIRNADIQGVWTALEPTVEAKTTETALGSIPRQALEDSYIRAYNAAISVRTPFKVVSSGDEIGDRRILLNRVKFDPWPGRPIVTVSMTYTGNIPNTVLNLAVKDEFLITDYNQVFGQNFTVFYKEQAPSFVLPVSTFNANGTTRMVACPVGGLTNQQCHDQFNVSLGGALATCAIQRADMVGFACIN